MFSLKSALIGLANGQDTLLCPSICYQLKVILPISRNSFCIEMNYLKLKERRVAHYAKSTLILQELLLKYLWAIFTFLKLRICNTNKAKL